MTMTTKAPFYQEQGNEITLFNHAFEHQLPVLIKGLQGVVKHVLLPIWLQN